MLVTRSLLTRQLAELGVRPGSAAMVHCRMSALDHVIGGAEIVVRALLDALGPTGTLMTYTGWQDSPPDGPDKLDETSRQLYLHEQPVYDPRVASARREHGRLAEALRIWPGALHSGHPEAGVDTLGPHAAFLVTPHELDDAYGECTPYARLVELEGQVVLLGAPLDTLTLVHHAEAIARVSNKRRDHFRVPVIEGGQRVWRAFLDIDTGSGALPYERVLGEEDNVSFLARLALEENTGRLRSLGDATGYVFEAAPLVACAVSWLEVTFGLDATESKDSR